MGTISRYNSVQFENLNANELVGVTLVYKSVNRDGETHYSGLNLPVMNTRQRIRHRTRFSACGRMW